MASKTGNHECGEKLTKGRFKVPGSDCVAVISVKTCKVSERGGSTKSNKITATSIKVFTYSSCFEMVQVRMSNSLPTSWGGIFRDVQLQVKPFFIPLANPAEAVARKILNHDRSCPRDSENLLIVYFVGHGALRDNIRLRVYQNM